ncbi:putative F-box protein At1g58310 [Vicia villosa]|uniref:putative F-box protein At1g58310 n=1 Tax=Vicia villosa TaxID=3911 RepID=UPI00273C5A00|nr:putative F-box protein At1g58310 [Vicia villosa]
MKNKRDRKEKRDRLSDLPDYVLLHIMKFINTKQAVQTCILSMRWKDLWRRLTNLTLNFFDFTRGTPYFASFVSSVLYHRDDSVSLHDIDLTRYGCIRPELIDKIMTYANSHDVHSLRLEVDLSFSRGYSLHTRIFSCQSLTHLKLSIRAVPCMTQLPSSLHLPALQSLHLVYATFTANDNGVSDPFSNCHRLNTLVLECCNLHRGANLLCVSNSNLSSLTIGSTIQEVGYKIVLSTPNLNSITLTRDLIHQISVCNISYLEQVHIDVEENDHMFYEITFSGLISCLQVLANYVKILKLSWSTLKVLLRSSDSMITQLPYFVKLKSLKFRVNPSNVLDDNVRSLVDCFVKKCPPAIVYIDFRA